jgi:hypothetical protein
MPTPKNNTVCGATAALPHPKAGRLLRVVPDTHTVLHPAKPNLRGIGQDRRQARSNVAGPVEDDARSAHVGQKRRVPPIALPHLGHSPCRTLYEAPRNPLLCAVQRLGGLLPSQPRSPIHRLMLVI